MKNYTFTSEAVGEGHPDKVADQISDAILDAYIERDKSAHVAVETLVTTNLVVIAGEISADTGGKPVDVETIVRKTIGRIGYTKRGRGFSADDVKVEIHLHRQSSDINRGVRQGTEKQGAGDNGLMFGYAVNETEDLMPLPHFLATRICRKLAKIRRKGDTPFILQPDCKALVSVRYEDRKPVHVESVTICTQHEEFGRDDLFARDILTNFACLRLLPDVMNKLPRSIRDLFDKDTKVFVNPTGRFVKGGPDADTGLTGRKVIVDTYGGRGAHGGGAFSGKDPSKVDRSGAYIARYIAKNIVAADIADECLVQIGYQIGKADPVSLYVDTFGTSKEYTDEQIAAVVSNMIPTTPHAVEEFLHLRETRYEETAAYGHFGRRPLEMKSPLYNGGKYYLFPWERIDKTFRRRFNELAK